MQAGAAECGTRTRKLQHVNPQLRAMSPTASEYLTSLSAAIKLRHEPKQICLKYYKKQISKELGLPT